MIKSDFLRNVGTFARAIFASACLIFAISNAYSDNGKKEEPSSKGQYRKTGKKFYLPTTSGALGPEIILRDRGNSNAVFKDDDEQVEQYSATRSNKSADSTQRSTFRSRTRPISDNFAYDMSTRKNAGFRPRTKAVSESGTYDMSTRKNAGFRPRTRAVSESEINSEDLGPLLKDDANDFWLDK